MGLKFTDEKEKKKDKLAAAAAYAAEGGAKKDTGSGPAGAAALEATKATGPDRHERGKAWAKRQKAEHAWAQAHAGGPPEPSAASGAAFGPEGWGATGKNFGSWDEPRSVAGNMFGDNPGISMQNYREMVESATEHGNVLDEKGVAGQGPKSGGVVPIVHVQSTRFYFRAADFQELAKYYKDGDLQMEKAKEEFTIRKAISLIKNVVSKYGTALMIRKAHSEGSEDERLILSEAIELRQLTRAMAIYQRETQGMYQAENTVTSAVDSAVDAIVNGTRPGLYPFSGSTNGALMKHAKQPNEAKRPAIQGEFKSFQNKRIKPFRPVNYA